MRIHDEHQRQLNWKIGLVALLLSLLIHQAVFVALDVMGAFQQSTEETQMRVSVLEEPAPPVPPKPPSQDPPTVEPAPTPQTATAPPRKTAPRPAPAPEPAVPETIEPPLEPVPDPLPPRPTSPATTPPLQTRLNWNLFDKAVGQTAVQEREAYVDRLQTRRSSGGGGVQVGQISAKVQRALQTHRSWITGAPQEPVGSKAAIFRNYLDATHDQIHLYFADTFLPSLISLGSSHPLNNFSLNTLVEFQILENGTINEVRVIRTSGQAMFDAGAVDSLYRASPFLPPPRSILSYDNRVYFRWGFYRNQRKCGTFNATGYILTGPAASPAAIPEHEYPTIDG